MNYSIISIVLLTDINMETKVHKLTNRIESVFPVTVEQSPQEYFYVTENEP